MSSLADAPWNQLDAEAAAEVLLPRGMIGEEERKCFHYLARHCIGGKGSIVDAGAFIGASAFCFASGLSRNPKYQGRKQVIHSYDQFKVHEDYVGEFISNSLRPIKPGDSFLDIYKWQTGKYSDLILSHEGDLEEQTWDGGRIDILFVDISKLIRLNSHVVGQFFPSLVPGESYVVQQDFYHCWHPYIHITMEYLSDKFETVASYVPYHSRVYKLIDALPADRIRRLVAYDFTAAERLELLNRFIDRESGSMRGMARTIKMCQHWMDDDLTGYAAERAKLDEEFPIADNHELYAGQARQLDELVAKGERCHFM